MSFLSYIRGIIPLDDNNLANAFADDQRPIFDTFGWSQFRVRRLMNVLQPPQIFINQAVPTSGIGGLIQGNIVYQALGPNPNPNQ